MRLSLLRCLENLQSLIDYPLDYTVHGLLWDDCIFSSGECNVLIAIYSLEIVVITVV